MTRTAPLVRLGCVPRMSAPLAAFVQSTHLGARAVTLPLTRLAWHLASVFDIKSRFLSDFVFYMTKLSTKQ